MGAVERLAGLQTSHAQSPREVCCCSARGMCLVTDYTGDNLGLRTMRALLQERARPVENAECRRAAEHVLGAIAAAHAAGIPDGALTLNRLLVDRAGRISVELLGLWSAVRGYGDSAQARRNDVTEAVRMIRAMVIGRAEVDDLGGGSLRPAVIAEAWAGWISQGAGEGFETADAALAALPPTSSGVPTVGVVRGLFDRIRSAVSGS